MFFAHTNDPGIGTDHQHAEIGRVPGHSENSSLQILFVTGQIDKCDDLTIYLLIDYLLIDVFFINFRYTQLA